MLNSVLTGTDRLCAAEDHLCSSLHYTFLVPIQELFFWENDTTFHSLAADVILVAKMVAAEEMGQLKEKTMTRSLPFDVQEKESLPHRPVS